MSRYQDLYNKQREWKGSSNQQNRKSDFKNARKERRTRMFDLFRGDLAATAYKPGAIKPIPKITFRDTISKLLGEKKRVTKKLRPFVVGTVKHKIHSPPFLHGPLRNKSPKKKLIAPLHVKSFAPMNYKFKGPKGLKINLFTPLAEEKTVMSPFMLNTVWNKLDDKTTKKAPTHDNITVRTQKRKPACLNSSSSSVFSTETSTDVQKNDEYGNAKRELWPEDQDDEPIFGRWNILQKRLSSNTVSQGNEKEDCNLTQEKINHSVHLDSSFQSHKEGSENPQSLKSPHSSDFANMSYKSTKYPDGNAFKASDKSKLEQTAASRESTKMGYRVSQISPPKDIFLNIIPDFNDIRMRTGIDNTIVEEEDSLCSTPIVQSVFKITSQQAENRNDTPIPSDKLVDEMIALNCLSPIYNNSSKDIHDKELLATAKESLLMDSPIATPKATTESPSNKTLTEKDTIEEILPCCENTRIENINSTMSPIQDFPIHHNHSETEDNNAKISPIKTSTLNVSATENAEKILNSTYTKFSAVIEEDEENEELEELQPSLEKSQKDCKKNNECSSFNRSTLNSTNNNKQRADPKNLDEVEHGLILSNDTPNLNESIVKETNDIFESIAPPLSNTVWNKANNKNRRTTGFVHRNITVRSSGRSSVYLDSPAKNVSSTETIPEDVCVNIPPVSRNSLTDNCSDQTISAIQENVNAQESLEKQPNKTTINSSPEPASDQINTNEDESSNSSLKTPVKNVSKMIIDHNTSVKPNYNHSQSQESELSSSSSVSSSNNSPTVILAKVTNFDHENPETNGNTDNPKDGSLDTSLKTPVKDLSKISSEHNISVHLNNDDSQAQEIELSTLSTESSSNGSPTVILVQPTKINQENPEINDNISNIKESCRNKAESLNNSSKTSVKNSSKMSIEHNTSVKPNDNQSPTQESELSTSSSDSSSNNSPTVILAKVTNVNHENPETNDNTDNFKASCRQTKCDKLCCQVDIGISTRAEKENGLAAKPHDATDIANTVPNKTLNEIHKPEKVSSISTIEFKVTTPTGLETCLLRTATNKEDTHAGTVQSRVSADPVPVIDLTDSPVEPVKRMSTKPTIRMSALDYKSPLLTSIKKRHPLLSASDENGVVDLISDDEDDYTSFVQRVLRKYTRNSNSPKQSPKPRTPLASIGNTSVYNVSIRQTPQSPLVNSPAKKNIISPAQFVPRTCITPSAERMFIRKDISPLINSPAEKTLVSPVRIIPMEYVTLPSEPLCLEKEVPLVKVTVETPVEKAQVLRDTPRKTPWRPNAVKNIGTETEEAPSPLRVMSLRTRNVSVSPSPKKVTPRKAPGKRKAAKEVVTEEIENANHLQVAKNISALSSPKEATLQVETSCKTPVRRNVVKEVATEVEDDPGHLRVISLRSRNVSVSPSPKKMTPRRRKNDNQRV